MSSSTAGKHAVSGVARPAVVEPTFAERAGTLVYLGRVHSSLRSLFKKSTHILETCGQIYRSKDLSSVLDFRMARRSPQGTRSIFREFT
jgi:hypothetical protein